MKIVDRYYSATRSSNLRSKAETTHSDTDVLGAFGLASRAKPLGVALHRLFTGDNGAARQVVDELAMLARNKFHELRRLPARDIAQVVLDWNRNKACPACRGQAFELIPGTPSKSTKRCGACKGEGIVKLGSLLATEHRPVAEWIQAQIESNEAEAGQAAMEALAPRLNL